MTNGGGHANDKKQARQRAATKKRKTQTAKVSPKGKGWVPASLTNAGRS